MTEGWPPYAKWQARLRGENPPMHESEPEEGFWRGKLKDGKEFVGIAIWPDPRGGFYATRDKTAVRVDWVWPWCGQNPVTEEAFRIWETTGTWPDDHRIEAPASNHNEPTDEAEILADQIASAKAGAADYTKVESDEQAARGQSLRSRLLELKGAAEKKHKIEKAPSLEEGRRIDARWLPLAKEADVVAKGIRTSLDGWENEKLRREREALRQADAERRRQVEAVRAAEKAGEPIPEPRTPSEPANVPPPVKAQIKGAYGKAASVRMVFEAIVEDYAIAAGYFQADPEVRAAVDKAAQRAANAGQRDIPGVGVHERRKVA